MTFSFSGSTEQTWTVPMGVSAALIEVWGAGGGSTSTTGGGGGGYIRGYLKLTPGDVYVIGVGGGGGSGSSGGARGISPRGGYVSGFPGLNGGAGGGAASYVAKETPYPQISGMVAGGGGGGAATIPAAGSGGSGGAVGSPCTLGLNAGTTSGGAGAAAGSASGGPGGDGANIDLYSSGFSYRCVSGGGGGGGYSDGHDGSDIYSGHGGRSFEDPFGDHARGQGGFGGEYGNGGQPLDVPGTGSVDQPGEDGFVQVTYH